ncbi:MAG: serine/threonine protein kinase [Proteobacteria bacterium]|nr:serine/threonine protein kinase [Pseudomonadota bacterium]
MLSPGETIERYVVENIIGRGGIATVYVVRHTQLDSRHALKVMSFANPDVRERLLMEGRVQATLRHTNVVAVNDVLHVQGHPGLLMEYIDGPAMDGWLRDYRPNLDEALAIFRGLLAGVSYAHEKGLIHRDLKPGNVLLEVGNKRVTPKVADFGLVKGVADADLSNPTRTGATLGTPAFMPPEQIRDASSVDQRADVYSLGCILYELVCGRAPFVGNDMLALFHMIATSDYPPPRDLNPDLPDALVELIDDMLKADRDERIASCAEVFERLGDGPHDLLLATSPGAQAALELRSVPSAVPSDSLSTLPTPPSLVPPVVKAAETMLTAVPPEPEQGRAMQGALVALLVLVVLLAGALASVMLQSGPSPAAVAEPQPEPTAVEAEVVPEPVAPPPVEAPEPEVMPEPVVAAPEPLPVPRPKPVKARPTGPSPASVAFEGAKMVVLESGDTRFALPAQVPAGRYSIRASFGSSWAAAGTVTVKPGETVTLECVSNFAQCRRP